MRLQGLDFPESYAAIWTDLDAFTAILAVLDIDDLRGFINLLVDPISAFLDAFSTA